MEQIKELFSRPIDRKIEEVIKVDQADQATVKNELEEYVATDSILDHYRTVYDEIIQVSKSPREGIGMWVSGFFGSGKSSFAKIIGYTVANIPVLDKSASEIFKENVKDSKISGCLDIINRTLPTDAVIFDVSMDRGVRTAGERITEIMYKALLRRLDYAEDFDLAKLEITLEGDGLLEQFTQKFEEIHGKPWKQRRKLALAINEASRVLHKMDPETYSTPDSYAHSIGAGRADINPNELAKAAFDLTERRLPGKSLIFVIDEVGQYVSRSVDKMLDLQAVIQSFGVEGTNRVSQKRAPAPFWIVVTSQEKLNEIVDSLDSKKIELARLQERFRIPIDLKQNDIPKITGERVLSKTKEAREKLSEIFDANEGRLNTFCRLERTSRATKIEKEEFINLYPYLPYQIDLCIDIVAGLRLKRGAHRHIGGSNRTIIKQAQEMMINPHTQMAKSNLGDLVTLDKVYELLYLGNLLSTETTREIDRITKDFSDHPKALKVVKAIALLETVKDLPRSVQNIAVVLHPRVDAESIKKEVEEAINMLETNQIIRDSDEGYKLLTVQEKNWDIKRNEMAPKPADRNRLIREIVKEIFTDPKIKTYRYKNLKNFRLKLSVENVPVESEGQIQLNMLIAEDTTDLTSRCEEARSESISKQNEIFWVAPFNDEMDRLLLETFRSREMISSYERLAAQGKLTAEESTCLSEEKVRRDRYHRQLRNKITESIQGGTGFFRGVQKDASGLGTDLPAIFQKYLDTVVPDLYPKLEMGIRQLSGNEADKFLSAANLNNLPPVFYDGDNGLFLVAKQGGKYIPNLSADICKEILTYLVREHKYGNKVTGKMLESHFQGIGYGWDREVIQLVLAVLLRGGAVEVTHQGRKYRHHNDPACKVPFTKVQTFRAASFAPREAIDLKTLTKAADNYEEITGKEVDIEEGAIAEAFKNLAYKDRETIIQLVATMKANNFPGTDYLEEHRQTINSVLEMPNDDCVRTLAGEGKSYMEARQRSAKLNKTLTEQNIAILKKARKAYLSLLPVLKKFDDTEELQTKAQELIDCLEDETFYEHIEAIRQATKYITDKYNALYQDKHEERAKIYSERIDSAKGLPEAANLNESELETTLEPLKTRSCDSLSLSEDGVCNTCNASLEQIETDISIADAIHDQVVKKLKEMTADPEEKIERVHVSQIFSGTVESEEDVETVVSEIRNYLLKLLASGARVILE
ncbi:hypothetical protein HNR65_003169 [Desulfosalsimonas propionicica]|uniref:BREX system P-loop protein BrxC n=1 Tax=Desulfosalsimonas propionicica TaxID=332175 RepID=A0A7W0HLY8_9BACT|nr:BREX system P-loop protein BrxC [Desulfosalsimonas propionicica]MBA2882814.1 hypothetical protein [Desulfosalsimonas propionicica]